MERIGGRRRSVLGDGGAELCVCAYAGPLDLGVDLLVEGAAVAARVRGGTMEVRDFHVHLASGERLRLFGAPPRVEVFSDRRAPTEVRVAEEGAGWRAFTFVEGGPIAGVLRTRPADGTEPWLYEVSGFVDALRTLAVLHAAERLLREAETTGTAGTFPTSQP